MTLRGMASVLPLLLGLVGCGGAKGIVRLDTGAGTPLVHAPRAHSVLKPVALADAELAEALVAWAKGMRPSKPALTTRHGGC